MNSLNSTNFLRIGLFLLFAIIHLIRADIFNSLDEMEQLLETEAVLINNMERYIDVLDSKIDHLKLKVQEYKREHTTSQSNKSAYLSNPINTYLLIKRLTSDWAQIQNLMEHDVGKEFLQNITCYRSELKFPTNEDLNGAAAALMRIQDIYELDTSSVARGEINGIQYGIEMSSNDCFELGRQSYLNEDYRHTVSWMFEAFNRSSIGTQPNLTDWETEIFGYMAFAKYKQGDLKEALEITNVLLELAPNHEPAKDSKLFYEQLIKETPPSDKIEVADTPIDLNRQGNPMLNDPSEEKIYRMLCRGELKPSPEKLRPLRCKYMDNDLPYLKIGPFKIEEASLDPYLIIFYDVIYDGEIEVVKKLSRPIFHKAMVAPLNGDPQKFSRSRVSNIAWLWGKQHEYIKNIRQRVADMTGLSLKAAEELQVANYGIGGHYAPHFDFTKLLQTSQYTIFGDRIATVIFYLNDVEQGGATAFPIIRQTVWPKKGIAAFWYNLHESGELDYRTKHAACPVLLGTKWVSNLWIHEREQEFRRPCNLKPDNLIYE